MSNWDLWTYSVTVVPFCYHDSLIPWIVPTDIYSLFSHLLCDDCYHVLLLLIVFPLKGNPAFENLHLWFCWGPLLHLVNKEWRPKNHGPMFSRIQTLSYKWVINSLQWQSNRSTGEILELQLAPSSIFPQCPSNKPLLIADCARYWTLWYLVFWVFKLLSAKHQILLRASRNLIRCPTRTNDSSIFFQSYDSPWKRLKKPTRCGPYS
jgi:hypothetical protein